MTKWLERLSNLSARQKRILRWLGYPLFYLFFLTFFFRVLFPYERLKRTLVSEFSKTQTGPKPMRLEVDEMSSYGLFSFGVEADGLRLISLTPKLTPEGKPGVPDTTTVEHVHATFGVLSALFGTKSIQFGAEAFGGDLSGNLEDSAGERVVMLNLDDVDLGKLPFLTDIIELPLKGQVNGRVELVAPEHDLAKAEGSLRLTAADIVVGDGKAKIRNTIALPTLLAGNLEIEAEVKKGKLTFKKFSIAGGELDLDAQGTIDLREPFGQSTVNIQLEFKFADSYKSKNDMTRGLFGDPKSNVPGVFDLDPQSRRAKNPRTGGYGFRLLGLMNKPTTQPDANAMAGRGRASSVPAKP